MESIFKIEVTRQTQVHVEMFKYGIYTNYAKSVLNWILVDCLHFDQKKATITLLKIYEFSNYAQILIIDLLSFIRQIYVKFSNLAQISRI